MLNFSAEQSTIRRFSSKPASVNNNLVFIILSKNNPVLIHLLYMHAVFVSSYELRDFQQRKLCSKNILLMFPDENTISECSLNIQDVQAFLKRIILQMS